MNVSAKQLPPSASAGNPDHIYLCIDLNNAEKKEMSIFLEKTHKYIKFPKSIGITNHVRP